MSALKVLPVGGAVNRVQGAVAPILEDVVRSDSVSLCLAVVVRVRRGAATRAERSSRHLLHALNLPTGSDIRRLLAQGAMIERRVQELTNALEDAKVDQGRSHAGG